MMQNNNSLIKFQKIFVTTPCENYFKLHNIYNVEFRHKWGLPNRTIDDFILAFVRDGSGYYNLNGAHSSIEKGKIFIISPDFPHSAKQYDITPSLISIRFGIYSNATDKYMKNTTEPFALSYLSNEITYYNNLFERMYRHYIFKTDNNVDRNLFNGYIEIILSELLLEMTEKINNSSYDMRLESARLYIERNITKNITIDQLCHISGLSKPYFSKLFKRQFGITPQRYIFSSRMNYAKYLLTQTDYNVKETAFTLGYSDPFIFSNQFKKFFGYSPSRAYKIENHNFKY